MALDKAHFKQMMNHAVKMKWTRLIPEEYYWAGTYTNRKAGEEELKAALALGFNARLIDSRKYPIGRQKGPYFWLGIAKER